MVYFVLALLVVCLYLVGCGIMRFMSYTHLNACVSFKHIDSDTL